MSSVRRVLRPSPELATPAPVSFTTAQVIRQIRRASTASAGGLSGTTYRTLRFWFHEPDNTSDDLTLILNHVAAWKVPIALVPLFTAGLGIAIPKNDKGDLRPIVIGHVLLRLIGSLALKLLSPSVQKYFLQPSALQFGVGVSGGCEIMVAAISAHLERFPQHIDVAADAKNAFNTWCRSQLWTTLHRNFPSLYAFVKLVYGASSDIIFFEPDAGASAVPNSVGSRQGCSLGSFLYCLAIHPLLVQMQEEYPELLVVAFCDDVHFVGDPAKAAEAYKRWAYLYSRVLQGELRDDKGIAYSPTLDAELLYRLGLPVSMPVNNEGAVTDEIGVRVLGAPVGNLSFKQKICSDIISKIESDMNVIGRMPSLQSQHLLTTKSVIHRINHLLRCIPGGEFDLYGVLGERYDSAILSVVRRITRCRELPELARCIAQLPLSEGGLGYRSWSSVADVAFVASYVNSAYNFPILFPSRPYLAQSVPDLRRILSENIGSQSLSQHASFAVRAVNRLIHRCPGIMSVLVPDKQSTIRFLQHSLSQVCDRSRALEASEAITRQDDKKFPWRMALFNSNCGDPVSFGTVPTDDMTTANNNDFEIMTLRRLLMQTSKPPSENFSCPVCHRHNAPPSISSEPNKVVDLFGNHALNCMKDGTRTKLWHDRLKRVLLSLIRMAGFSGAKEEVSDVLLVGPSGMRADVLFHGNARSGGHKQYILDVRSCNPTEQKVCSKAASLPGAAALAGVTQKNNKWKPFVDAQGDVFMALCFEAGGRLGDQIYCLLDLLAQQAHCFGPERDAFLTYARQRLHLVNQICVAQVIRAHEPICNGPHVVDLRGTLDLSTPVSRPTGTAIAATSGRAPSWLQTQLLNSTTHDSVRNVHGVRPPARLLGGGTPLRAMALEAITPQPFESPETTTIITTTTTCESTADPTCQPLWRPTQPMVWAAPTRGTAGISGIQQRLTSEAGVTQRVFNPLRPNGPATAPVVAAAFHIPPTNPFDLDTGTSDLADIAIAAAAFSLLGE